MSTRAVDWTSTCVLFIFTYIYKRFKGNTNNEFFTTDYVEVEIQKDYIKILLPFLIFTFRYGCIRFS